MNKNDGIFFICCAQVSIPFSRPIVWHFGIERIKKKLVPGNQGTDTHTHTHTDNNHLPLGPIVVVVVVIVVASFTLLSALKKQILSIL